MKNSRSWRTLCAIVLAGCSAGSSRDATGTGLGDATGVGVGGALGGRGGPGGGTDTGVGTGTAAGAGTGAGPDALAVVGGEGGAGSSRENCDAADVARVDNPFAGVTGYVNPEWRAKALAEPGGDAIADTPTAVWLDRIAAIEGTANSQSNGPMGLRDHLDAALAQGAGTIQFVIYDLPGRDCSALASNGELGPDDLERYKSEYVDPIVEIMGDPCYRSLRIVNVI